MNEFIEQFLIECRELVEQGTADLLALEEQPGDRDRLDGAFRAFHTLKGGAGIVDFTEMARALHAAEDLLASVRAGAEPVTIDLVSDCLTCLDQVVQWLDAMEHNGEIPANAGAESDAIVRRFTRDAPPPASSGPLLEPRTPGPAARTSIRYRPDKDAFFRGEDPLAILEALPGLVELRIEPENVWPALEDLDPFASHLVIHAATTLSPAETAAHFAAVSNQVDVRAAAVAVPPPAGAKAKRGEIVRLVLEAQLRLLAESSPDGQGGRVGSAGRTARAALLSAGRPQDAAQLDRAVGAAAAAGDPAVLAGAIQAALQGPLPIPQAPQPAAASAQPAARSLRVDVERIDALVKLAGEMTTVKNALGHAAALAQGAADPKVLASLLKDQHAQLNRLVAELQGAVLNIRVLPLGQVFQRFPRLVREMAAELGKPVRFIIDGDDTEADKVVAEALFEPLLHVIRNALDHGLESPGERVRLGKPAPAVLRLSAARRGDTVVVEVEDDGAGVNLARVRQVAVQRGVADADALADMSDDEVVGLIFAPGFSTASEVTGLSGRGVGMDAVRASVERLGGRVAVDSRPGVGMTVRFVLPFTVMMTRVMTVEAGGQLFGVPLDAIVETVRVPRSEIKPVGAARAIVLRNRTIPLVELVDALGEGTRPAPSTDAHVVVTQTAGQWNGLEVDRLGERMDVMLKPMEGLLAGMPHIAGATLLGDGRVLLVLDLQELLQ